jgi:hypothetical protein
MDLIVEERIKVIKVKLDIEKIKVALSLLLKLKMLINKELNRRDMNKKQMK